MPVSLQVKNYEGDAADLGLDFVVADETLGQRTEHELIFKGAETAVTDANKHTYVHLCAHWHLSRIGGAAASAFARGLAQVGIAPCSLLALPHLRRQGCQLLDLITLQLVEHLRRTSAVADDGPCSRCRSVRNLCSQPFVRSLAASQLLRLCMQVIPVSFLRLFSVGEVNELLAGAAEAGVDVQDLKAHTQCCAAPHILLPLPARHCAPCNVIAPCPCQCMQRLECCPAVWLSFLCAARVRAGTAGTAASRAQCATFGACSRR